ncbi:hypothetical protein TWF730_009795 [Orbilia blumenaviensis]|uniref:NACHT domain-containing protein n=1 Tax=Orbilia blumenaviensis TaxID=1796055 RepID=A0AAV9USS8_9PEZI
MAFNPSSPEPPVEDPMGRAFYQYAKSLSDKDLKRYQTAGATCPTAEDLTREVFQLQTRHKKLSKTLKVSTCIEPLVSFLKRHSSSVDTFVQANPFPAALVWGTIKVLLDLASYHIHYFENLVRKLQELGACLDVFRKYEVILKESIPVQTALAKVYQDIFVFLGKAKGVFAKRGSLLFARTLWKSFERDFGNTLLSFEQNKNTLEGEISIEHLSTVKKLEKKLDDGIRAGLGNSQQYNMRMNLTLNQTPAPKAVMPDENRVKITNWVSNADPGLDFTRESSRRVKQSGQWLLKHQTYKKLLRSSEKRLLRVLGSPGSGKTVLSTTIIEDLQSQNLKIPTAPNHSAAFTAYFYCSKSDQGQETLVILCGLIKQILSQFEELPECVTECYKKSCAAGRPSLTAADGPETLLETIVQKLGSLYIVVDGIDEVAEPQQTVAALLKLTKTNPNVKTILLSRDIFEMNSNDISSYPVIKLDGLNTSEDVNRFIKDRLNNMRMREAAKDLPPEIFTQISQKADGMFLWAKLMMDSLNSAMSVHDALDIVSSTPSQLDGFYDQVMMRLMTKSTSQPKMVNIARRVIMLMCAASRPLSWSELECMLNTEKTGIKTAKIFQSTILDACNPLIEYVPKTGVLRFVHLSVREFFLNASNVTDPDLRISSTGFPFLEHDAHKKVADICLTYLLESDPDQPSRQRPTQTNMPLLEYASTYWGFHILRSEYDNILSEQMHKYLSKQSRRKTWISKQLFRESSGFPLQKLINMQKELHKWDIGSSSGSDTVKNERLDWIQDVGRALVDIDSTETNAKDFASGKSQITYFEKLMVIRDLSREYTIRQRLKEGEKWMLDALHKRQNKFGEEHISTVWLLNSLGIIYDQQHRVELSAEIHEKALKIQETALGPNHLETVWTINELGRVYRHLKRYDDAVNMHLRAFEVLKKLLPENDLQLAWTLNTLARAYRKQGSIAESLECHRKAIDIQKVSLGEKHPHVLWATADIGRCYRDRKDLEKSAYYHRVCLEGRKEVLGLDHPDTLWAMNDLGLVLSEDGYKEEAKELHETALEGQTRLLGESHPHTVWSRKQIENINSTSWEEVGIVDVE